MLCWTPPCKVKSNGTKERYTHLNAEFQRISRRDKKAFCKEIEQHKITGKTRVLFKKIRDTKGVFHASSVPFSSVTQSCPTFCDPMNCSTPGLPVHHQLLESTQTHVSDTIQLSHPLSSPSPPAFNLSQQQGLFK